MVAISPRVRTVPTMTNATVYRSPALARLLEQLLSGDVPGPEDVESGRLAGFDLVMDGGSSRGDDPAREHRHR